MLQWGLDVDTCFVSVTRGVRSDPDRRVVCVPWLSKYNSNDVMKEVAVRMAT